MAERKNIFDVELDHIVDAMFEQSDALDALSENVPPFDSKELSVQEEELLYDNPNSLLPTRYFQALFPGGIDAETGVAPDFPRLRRELLKMQGPEQYVRWVDTVVARSRRRQEYAAGKGAEPVEEPTDGAPEPDDGAY